MEATTAVSATTGFDTGQAYVELGPRVWRKLQRMGVPHRMVEDVAQDVFLVAHQRAQEFRGDSSVSTWLMGIAAHLALNHRRKVQRSGEEPALLNAEQLEQCAADDAANPFENTARREASEHLQRILGRLDVRERKMWLLINVQGRPLADAASEMALSDSRAYTLLRTAERQFARSLGAVRARDQWRFR